MSGKSPKEDRSLTAITFDQQNAICHNLIAAGDHIADYEASLKQTGFTAFFPRQKFVEAFAANDKELDTHRRYIIAEAKWFLGRPLSLHATTVEEMNRIYCP